MQNGDVKSGLDALTELCGPSNRIPVLDSIQAGRSYTAFVASWAAPEKERLKLVEEHGTADANGSVSVSGDGLGPFIEAYNTILAGECDTPSFKPIPIASIEQGFSKDPETGERFPLDVSPAALMTLIELGLIDDGGR